MTEEERQAKLQAWKDYGVDQPLEHRHKAALASHAIVFLLDWSVDNHKAAGMLESFANQLEVYAGFEPMLTAARTLNIWNAPQQPKEDHSEYIISLLEEFLDVKDPHCPLGGNYYTHIRTNIRRAGAACRTE